MVIKKKVVKTAVKKSKKKIMFKFQAPNPAKEVKLCGSFTNWEHGAVLMSKGKTGEWKAQVSLDPGEYEYKFWADGVWYNDPSAERQISNDWGSENSLKMVK